MTPSLRLSVDGVPQDPVRISGDEYWFSLTFPAREIRLQSDSARPVDLGLNDGRSRLGVKILGIRLEQAGYSIELPLDNAEFRDGFHPMNVMGFRFTDGDALLPVALLPLWQGGAMLRVRAQAWRGLLKPRAPDQNLLMFEGFESLGANCEFAFAERHFRGSNRAGLLTWAGIASNSVAAALDAGFAGAGDPARSTLVWKNGEYRLRTEWLRAHTRVFEQTDAAGEREILERGCARLRLLLRKMLSDLATAKRIFVHTARHNTLPRHRMIEIHAALRRHGPARLLCVTDGAAQSGIRRVADGLYHARLAHFVGGRGPYDAWLTLCQAARDIDGG